MGALSGILKVRRDQNPWIALNDGFFNLSSAVSSWAVDGTNAANFVNQDQTSIIERITGTGLPFVTSEMPPNIGEDGLGAPYGFRSIACDGAGTWLVIDRNYAYKSTDGITWVNPIAHGLQSASYITYAGNYWIIYSTVNHAIYAISVDGINWTQKTFGFQLATSNNRTFIYFNGLYITVGVAGYPSSYVIQTSPDLNTWTPRYTSPNYVKLTGLISNGTNLAVLTLGKKLSGANPSYSVTSSNGINWTQHTVNGIPGGTGKFNGPLAYGNGVFLEIMHTLSTGNLIVRSTNGVNWTAAPVPTRNLPVYIYNYFYFNGLWYAFTVYSGVYTSVNGSTWITNQPQYAGEANGSYRASSPIMCAEDTSTGVVAVCGGGSGAGTNVGVSNDGESWVYSAGIGADVKIVSVGTDNNGTFVGVSQDKIYTSNDGITWTERNNSSCPSTDRGAVRYLYGYCSNVFYSIIAARFYAKNLWSLNSGITWTNQNLIINTPGVTSTTAFIRMAESANIIVGIRLCNSPEGSGLGVFSSIDGINCDFRFLFGYSGYNNNDTTFTVKYGNGVFIVIAYNTFYRSVDGINWDNLTDTTIATHFMSLDYGNGIWKILTPVTKDASDIYNYIQSTDDGVTWTLNNSHPFKSPGIFIKYVKNKWTIFYNSYRMVRRT